ncbi:MAG: TetR/AcrR family transcriptional regulator [Porticoccaceae bacterium]|nr:TetR/AcrR family transcriptional regulator [Porticoccaceae bacterium]
MVKQLSPRNEPVQNRARKQRDKILKVTSELLKTVGLDDLTTILVAKKVGISIGTLYHYFPNKHAILYALSELWIEKIKLTLSDIESENIEQMPLKPFVNLMVERLSTIYKDSSSVLPLVAAMSSTPELKKTHDKYLSSVYGGLVSLFLRLSISLSSSDATHLARFYWQICHSILSDINNADMDGDQSVSDLKFLLFSLLERAKANF